jgi:hypothetical protein
MVGVIDEFSAGSDRSRGPPVQMLASVAMVAMLLVGGLFSFRWMEGTVADRVYLNDASYF